MGRRAIKRNNETIPQLLVKWSNLSEADASWEDYDFLKQRFPTAILEDENFFEEGAMSGEGNAEFSYLTELNNGKDEGRQG
jgi:Chromo (CHRromatin Organisation MOdifier) domain